MNQNNIMLMGSMDNSYTMVDLYQNNKFFGMEILTIIMISMLKKYY